MNRVFSMMLVLVASACLPTVVLAWNDAGHMTVARITWDTLSADERGLIVAILRQHPHCDSLLRKDCPAEASDEEWIFMRAAIWADYVRPPKGFPGDDISTHPLYKFHRGNWHYVNFPYQAGQKSSELPDTWIPNDTNILQQLNLTMEILVDRDFQDTGRIADLSDDQNRAVRMTWLFHLLGDLHQPLHTVALVDSELFPDPPHTDQGGNKLAIRTDASSISKNLHWFWDEMFSKDSHYDQVCRLAERLTHDPSLRPEQLPELNRNTNFREWAAESYEAALTHVYQNGELKLVLWDDIRTGRFAESEVPFLPVEALQKARRQAERRIALAGYRLAAKLKEIARR